MMNELITAACELIRIKLGIAVSGVIEHENDDELLVLWPSDYHRNEAFTVVFRPGWRSADAFLRLGSFSAVMLNSIAAAQVESKQTFAAYFFALQNERLNPQILLNGTPLNPLEPVEWPAKLRSIEISVLQKAHLFDRSKVGDLLQLVDKLALPIFGMLAALIGVEELDEPLESEGRPFQTLLTKYERKRVNREACLRYHGYACKACRFDFKKVYGKLGEDYIEVHHLEPLSAVGQEHKVNPVTDLIPLCSNCHAMAHRRCPPVPLEELQVFFPLKDNEMEGQA